MVIERGVIASALQSNGILESLKAASQRIIRG